MPHLRIRAPLAMLVGVVACSGSNDPGTTQPPTTRDLLVTAVDFYGTSRGTSGLYRDRLRFDGAHEGPSSVATTGIGLVSLCIGDRLGVTGDARAQAAATIRTLLALERSRNASGFFYHFVDLETGERAYESEYSTIDTAILVAGALFAASCLPGDAELDSLVLTLWESIDWSRAVADPATGALYREMQEDGSGTPNTFTLPFNEYMLVAWFAAVADTAGTGPATEMWNRHYARPDSLPTSGFQGIDVLTDRPGAFLSSFVIEFAYYLCHPFTTSAAYRIALRNAAAADRAWWATRTAAASHEWGLGAGSARSVGYRADAIENNPDVIVSPHVVAGFLAVDSSGTHDLMRHIAVESRAVRSITGVPGTVLWRYSLADPAWVPQEIQGIDYAAMLLGLAAHEFGPSLFETHNDVTGWLLRVREGG